MPKEPSSRAPRAASKKKTKDPNAPKRPMTAYMWYATEHREEVRKAHPDAKFGDVGKLIGEQWRALSEKDKKKYEERAGKDKERYEEEKSKYQKGEFKKEDAADTKPSKKAAKAAHKENGEAAKKEEPEEPEKSEPEKTDEAED